MRRSPRTLLMALLLAVLAFAAVGCGGSEVEADEVPGGPATITVPTDGDIGTAAPDTSSSDTGASDTQDDSAATDSGAGTAAPESTAPPADTSGGATAPATEEPAPDSATNDTPPPAGSEAQQFEDFCAQNEGAC